MKTKQAEDSPRAKQAKQTVTGTRKYFVPGVGELEAQSLEDVEKQLKERQEEGDE